MPNLTWKDHSGRIMAYANAQASIEETIAYDGKKLPTRLWVLDSWNYTHRIAPQVSSGYPLNALLPTLVLLVDGKPVKGSSLILPGPWCIGRTSKPEFEKGVVFHVENFFTSEGVSLMSLLLALPELLNKHMAKITEVQGPKNGQ